MAYDKSGFYTNGMRALKLALSSWGLTIALSPLLVYWALALTGGDTMVDDLYGLVGAYPIALMIGGMISLPSLGLFYLMILWVQKQSFSVERAKRLLCFGFLLMNTIFWLVLGVFWLDLSDDLFLLETLSWGSVLSLFISLPTWMMVYWMNWLPNKEKSVVREDILDSL